MLTWRHLKSKRSFLQVRHVDRIDGFAVRLRPLVCHALARTIRRQYSQCEGLAGRLCIPCDILEPRSSKSSDVGRADPNNDITIKHRAGALLHMPDMLSRLGYDEALAFNRLKQVGSEVQTNGMGRREAGGWHGQMASS